jgi:hypothetical protein
MKTADAVIIILIVNREPGAICRFSYGLDGNEWFRILTTD